MSRTATSPVHFLLVDDLEENLLALGGLLRRDGLELLKARSGPEALELLLRHEVALALVDVRMPGMDGFELAELMRGTERTRRVPIIFLTAGAADQQRRFRGYGAGAVDFLCKPVEPDVLKSKADVFFDLYRQRQEVARQRDELRAATEENARLLAESQRYAAALREADRRKDEFLATLAHELRNPLAPIRTALQMLKLDPRGEAAAAAREMMERQLGHLVRLIDDLLDVSRVSSGKLVLKPARVTVQAVVQAAVEASGPLVAAAGHELAVRLGPEPLWLDADPTRLAQVIGNLLNNAAKYTPEGGRVELSAAREGGEAVIRVTDTGVGIAPEMLPKVFEMFTQVGRTLERSQGGLGIGLALVKRLVEMHGGSVTADSPGPGRGSTFTVRLPLAHLGPAPVPPASASGGAGQRPAGRRVLVVDDNADAADCLALVLRHLGNEVRVAYDGEAALGAAAEFRPEVAVLDIGMPKLDGYELARRIRGEPWGADVLLVAQTGWGQDEDRRRSEEAGFAHHLVKPVDPGELLALLAGAGAGG